MMIPMRISIHIATVVLLMFSLSVSSQATTTTMNAEYQTKQLQSVSSVLSKQLALRLGIMNHNIHFGARMKFGSQKDRIVFTENGLALAINTVRKITVPVTDLGWSIKVTKASQGKDMVWVHMQPNHAPWGTIKLGRQLDGNSLRETARNLSSEEITNVFFGTADEPNPLQMVISYDFPDPSDASGEYYDVNREIGMSLEEAYQLAYGVQLAAQTARTNEGLPFPVTELEDLPVLQLEHGQRRYFDKRLLNQHRA